MDMAAEVALEEVVDTEADTAVVLEVAMAVDLEAEVDTAAVEASEVATEVVDLADMAILEADTISEVETITTLAPAVMAMAYRILVAGKYRVALNRLS